jgi:hypothetical protein
VAGTRIAISKATPAGEDLYISTGTQKERLVLMRISQRFPTYHTLSLSLSLSFSLFDSFRYARYDVELKAAFDKIVKFHIDNNMHQQDVATNRSLKDEGVKLCLELYFYWINFSPLSRCACHFPPAYPSTYNHMHAIKNTYTILK